MQRKPAGSETESKGEEDRGSYNGDQDRRCKRDGGKQTFPV